MHNHKMAIEKASKKQPSETEMTLLSSLFKVLGEETRLKILFLLYEGEMCVCAITEMLNLTQSNASHQLKILKDADLVGNRREGKTIFYFLKDDHVKKIIGQGYEHISESDSL